MKDESKPIDKIRELSEIQMEIFSIIDRIAKHDVNLASQKLRDATLEIASGMAKITDEYKPEEK